MPRKNKRRKEEICEDYCFACKDGGDVRVCDYKDCLKVYHPQCVGKDDSFLKSKDRWTCNWHSCFICHKTAKFHCFCCPKGVCGICLWDAEFALVKGGEGFCSHCLKLAILIEEKLDVDSDGGKVDFKERNTLEFLFQEYWQIIKEKQGLSAEHVHYAKNLLKSGIKKTSRTGVMNTEVFLQFSNMSKDVPIGKLSDDDFCQEECEDLHQRVKDGLLRRPTAELELKARRLHEDIMKHWIGRELSLLQKRIDKANEKGWRRELAQYMDKKLLLEMPSEQSRLLNEVPEVITDIENFEPTLENSPSHDKRQHDGLPEALRGSSQTPSSDKRENFEPTPENSPSHDKREHDGLPEALRGSSQILSSGLANGTLYYPKGGIDPADISKFGSALENSSSQDKQENDGSPFSAIKGPSQTPSTDLANGTLCYPNGRTDPAEVQGGIHHGRHRQYVHVEKKSSKVLFPKALEQKSLDFASKGQPDVSQQKPHHFSSGIVGERPSAPEDVQHKVKNQSTSEAEFIELSDDDEDVRGEIVAPAFEDPYSALWHCVSPLGDTRGPFKMSLLKQWNDSSDRELKFKVWREGQTKEEAIFLTDAIRQNFPGT
ncbi:hypothetical protein PRUPE_1G582800 [Prunus persica]|uniref:Zinc finger PHD-type domain-containing protein n=1 Tax=Prunus persica TaxID=3760 RepID=A0A251RK73_PRUPE|nr:hypothetical protein PRUPE_1G582800 [Prunus persica]